MYGQLSEAAFIPQSAGLQPPWCLISQILPHLQEAMYGKLSGAATMPQSAGLQPPWPLISQMLPHLHEAMYAQLSGAPLCHNHQGFKLCGLWSARRCPTYRCHVWSAVRSCFHATISRSSTPVVSDQPEAVPSIRGHVWSAVRSILRDTISISSSSVVSGQLDAASSTETSVSEGAPHYGKQSAAVTRGAALMDINAALPHALGRES